MLELAAALSLAIGRMYVGAAWLLPDDFAQDAHVVIGAHLVATTTALRLRFAQAAAVCVAPTGLARLLGFRRQHPRQILGPGQGWRVVISRHPVRDLSAPPLGPGHPPARPWIATWRWQEDNRDCRAACGCYAAA